VKSDPEHPSSLLGIHHRACGVFIPKTWVIAARKMYVIGKIEVEESISMLSLEEPEATFSAAEFEYYADIFEEMLERMEKEETVGEEVEMQWGQEEPGLSFELDEFDLAEIAQMNERFGLTREY
jgi:hypothetical protein